MKPGPTIRPVRHFLAWLSVGGLLLPAGCSPLSVRSQSPEDELEAAGAAVKLVGDYAVPFGMNPVAIEAVGLITGLPGTGSDPPPSPQRASLMDEMLTLGVVNPNQVLASPNTELVMVRGYLRPGIQKGDHFDVEVRVLSRSEGTSLRGGWLMKARLREMAVLGNRVREGNVMGLAEGPVLVDPSSTDEVQLGRGRILGGGVATVSRQLRLALKSEHRNVLVSAQVGEAINRRFFSFVGGIQQGVARPKTDEFIDLQVHPRYKDNIERYIRVIRALPIRETPAQQAARIALLERQLMDPITSSTAALRLEALGKAGIKSLARALESEDEEVRFYAAEALAYLDESAAAQPLGELARNVPAFRAYAMAALSAMDEFAAYEALQDLLAAPSAETRYGAFRALWAMNPRDPLVKGEELGEQFNYHVLDTAGPPMIHVTRSFRPEVVLFGSDQRLQNPLALEAGKNIMVRSLDDDRVTVSCFALNQPDQKRVVSSKVDDVIRTIVDLGGRYPDVVQALQQAKACGALTGRLEMDAVPRGGRTYVRKGADESEGETSGQGDVVVGNPLPDLYHAPAASGSAKADRKPSALKNSAEKRENRTSTKSLLGKLTGRD